MRRFVNGARPSNFLKSGLDIFSRKFWRDIGHNMPPTIKIKSSERL